MPKLKVAVWLLLGCFSIARSCSGAEILVFAAASLTETLKAIAADYQKQTLDTVLLNFEGSSTLARQIEEGAPADIFFSADEAQMDRLQSKGLIVAATRTNGISNTLVIVVPAHNAVAIHSPRDLAKTEVRRIALGDPRAVPIGVYARRYLEHIGLWLKLVPKIVPTSNVRAALAAVEAGNADASIVYKTDALVSSRVVIACNLPPIPTVRIRYPVALVRSARDPAAARQFLEYLVSGPAAQEFEKHGFLIPGAAAGR